MLCDQGLGNSEPLPPISPALHLISVGVPIRHDIDKCVCVCAMLHLK